jgi:hypothetical protein
MSFIPESIFHKIMLFNSHPVADMFKNSFQHLLEKSQYYEPSVYSFDMIWLLDRQMRQHEESEIPEDDEEFYE